MIDLVYVWIVLIGFGVLMYVLADGFDLGVGILFPFARDDAERDVMMNSVAPVWDGNETWLVLGGAGLLAAFPLVYTVFLPALYIGVFLMLGGLIFRGIAFEFRFKAPSGRRRFWNAAFFLGSLVAAFAQGAVVGTFIEGFETVDGRYVGGAMDWLTPFTVMTGFALVFGYALIGACWLVLKTEGPLQARVREFALRLLKAVMLFFLIISVWTPLVDDYVRGRWFDFVTWLWIFPVLTAAVAFALWRFLKLGHDATPFIATIVLFMLFYGGLLLSKWPYVVPPSYTFHDAASAPESQLFLLVGVLFVIPFVLMYTAWTYYVFRGKVRAGDGYH
ncbi:cytochrome d ubiquinol oxidase subunit II [Pseudazoarcus pumilus]|uniref:Cytochrome d ubiquinol oxidase subunit II n=1 Tax=Pseudazoarcus pumilus TaxID=2067960 RepID=A0A2I6S7K3_9RHOO|nr:cytochrome d ubiquinol oxidase subunit II [Pseudazoarcus pumilus]AUN95228.1 cytochrome d ubiquinol oxidase subunit II [Pseudazoarcus pumilus]